MNTAICITTTIIRAAEAGVELKIIHDKLRYRSGQALDQELQHLLKEHKTAIIERLNYDAVHPDPFEGFFDQCCLFYRGKGMAASVQEVTNAYQQWTRQSNAQALPAALLNKRLRELGCEEVTFRDSLCWEHVCIYWPAIESSADSPEVLTDPAGVKLSFTGDAETPAITPPTTGPELANPYSQTMCRNCGASDVRLQNVFSLGTHWGFKLCWECYAQRYGVYPNRSALGRPAMLEEAKRNHLSVWTADNGRLLKVSGPQESKALAHRLLSNAGAIREAIKFYPDAEMIVSLPDGVDTVFELTGLVREGEK